MVTDFRENILFLPVGLASNYHRECHQIRKYVIDRITFCRRACCCELSTFPKHPIQPAKKKWNYEWMSYLYENLSSSSLLQWSPFIKQQRTVTVLRPKPIKGQLSWLGFAITDDPWGSQFFRQRYLFMLVFHFHAPICLNHFFLLFARSIFPLTPILISLSLFSLRGQCMKLERFLELNVVYLAAYGKQQTRLFASPAACTRQACIVSRDFLFTFLFLV